MVDVFEIIRVMMKAIGKFFPKHSEVESLRKKHKSTVTVKYDVCINDHVLFRNSKFD
jgi:hypothetical protein